MKRIPKRPTARESRLARIRLPPMTFAIAKRFDDFFYKKEENHNNLKTNQNFLNKTIKLEINRNVY